MLALLFICNNYAGFMVLLIFLCYVFLAASFLAFTCLSCLENCCLKIRPYVYCIIMIQAVCFVCCTVLCGVMFLMFDLEQNFHVLEHCCLKTLCVLGYHTLYINCLPLCCMSFTLLSSVQKVMWLICIFCRNQAFLQVAWRQVPGNSGYQMQNIC